MDLHFYASTLALIAFGSALIIFSIREEKTRQKLLERDRKQKQRLYELSIIKEIQERIGYELDFEKIIDVVIGSLQNIFPYSSASSLFVKEDRLVLKTYLQEEVNQVFVSQVKKNMLASLTELLPHPLPTRVEENVLGALVNNSNKKELSSFFHLPLTVNNNVVGILSLCSTKAGLYKEEEMGILHQITSQASNTISRLKQVLDTEKGKIMAIIASLADGVFMINTHNQLLLINDAAKRLLQIHKENPNIFDVISSFSQQFDLTEKINEAISKNKTIEEKELALGEKTVQVFVTPVTDTTTNRVLGVSILLNDITLEKEVLKLKEDFTNMMVHELRAPLTSIKGASDLMLKDGGVDEKEQKKFLALINSESKLLLEYVSSLLDAAKIESGRLVLQKTTTDIQKIVEEVSQVFIPQAKLKNIEITTHFDQNLPLVSCDGIRINQVLTNLISNSLKFTPDGGKIKVEVLGPDKTSNVTVSVSDTGIGIPKEKQGSLFTRFTQVKSQGQQQQSGTGLGLFISKGIIEAHGGTILLDSEENKGTTISFTLPVSENQSLAKEDADPPRSALFGTPLN